MFILKNCIAASLLPPGLFIMLLLVSGVWLWRRRQLAFGAIHAIVALLLWALSLGPVANALTGRLEDGLTIPSNPRGDVIILLGGGIYEGVADLTGSGAPGENMLGRLVTAVRLQRQLGVPVIVSGGSGYGGRSPEAPVIGRFLRDLGVEAEQVLLETRSRDTEENARYSREIMIARGYRHPLLVTSAYHMRRSVQMFQRVGVPVTPVPAQFRTGADLPLIWADFLPGAGALHQSEKALREYLGLLFYRLAG